MEMTSPPLVQYPPKSHELLTRRGARVYNKQKDHTIRSRLAAVTDCTTRIEDVAFQSTKINHHNIYYDDIDTPNRIESAAIECFQTTRCTLSVCPRSLREQRAEANLER